MFTENHPEQTQTFYSGANYDIDPEKLFADTSKGVYLDAHNMEPTSNDGVTGSIQRIRGEILRYENATNGAGYKCMASGAVNGYLYEIWAPLNDAFPRIVRVNGSVVLSSVDFDISILFPIQARERRSIINNEIVVTDYNTVPYVFDLKDMVDSLISEPTKYFSTFDKTLYQVNIQSALDHPILSEIASVGGGGGKPAGQYQYQMRYASESGDRTNWSHPTPLIAVPQTLSNESPNYPWHKTVGGPPNPNSRTSFAPKIKFRVTNLYNYDYIEIKCLEYNSGAGLNFVPSGRIIGRIDVSPGEISVREFIDPVNSNVDIAISPQSETQQLAHIKRAKTARFFGNKLVFGNVELASKEVNLTFESINGKKGFPVMYLIGKEGHKSPLYHTYRKPFMHGEKYGLGVNVYDCVGNKGFSQPIDDFENYQFPNRRQSTSAETEMYSPWGTVKAGLADNPAAAGQTHEVFSLTEGTAKTTVCDFKNIMQRGRIAGVTGTKTKTGINQECDETDGEIENHGANVSGLGMVSTAYHPFHPTGINDSDVSGHNYTVNTKVSLLEQDSSYSENSETEKSYRPAGFGPSYYSMGIAISGIDNFPEWAKAFSVVRTQPAGRVVCQGVGYYSLFQGKYGIVGNAGLAGKNTNRIHFFSPDINSGVISSEVVNDILLNPQNYSMQFVSPLGFFSEWYSAENNTVASERDRMVDMISYVRMLRDREDGNGINPGEDSSMGVSGGDGYRYIVHDRFRNHGATTNYFSNHPDKGNRNVPIYSATRVSEGRGDYISIGTDAFYATQYAGSDNDARFSEQGMKDWTEPVFIVNIIRTGANIIDTEIQKYVQTSHYQKIESIIGKSNGEANQEFELVDERWEDCVPFSPDGMDRYIYIKLPNGTVQKWINVVNKTAAQKSAIHFNILSGIGDVSGMYSSFTSNYIYSKILFNVSGYIPPTDSLILVRYDKTAPIRVFGGDTFIGESIFSPIDRQASAKDNEAETQFAFGIGLPYNSFKLNPRYYTIRNTSGANEIQDKEWFSIGYIRQLAIMFTCEARTAIHLAYNGEGQNQYFPVTNYVIRPNRWEQDKDIKDNKIYEEYDRDYGLDEKSLWKWGGIRFLPQHNIDYSVFIQPSFFSKPKVGFEEQNLYQTGLMWSLTAPVNVRNAPGIKTFPVNNFFTIDDKYGEIKYLYDDVSGRGENLYAVTDYGICLLVTSKSILSDLNAGELGYMANGQFITQQYWINRDVGMNDEMWRSATECFITSGPEGQESVRRALFFANKNSVYRMIDNNVDDIAGDYKTRLYNALLSLVQPGNLTEMCSVFDQRKEQFYIQSSDGPEDESVTFAFSQKNNMWIGTNAFTFDRYTSDGQKTYGHRNLETYELNVGHQINGENIDAWILSGASPESDKDKEFIRIRINSSQKPTMVEFYKEKTGVKQCSLSPLNGQYYLKNYRGWENFISRIDSAVSVSRPLFQGRLILFKIFYNLAEEFRISDTTISYKKLK